MKLLMSLLISLVIMSSLSGCAPAKKSRSDLSGLMLLENTQLGRNRSYYSKHGRKKLIKKHARFHKKVKKKAQKKIR
ncbi:MAG TPA: hypothetical protein VJ963_09730 [Bacteroidales bacterium]|nr:hypothetical protein [Bacteroidales bacterium]